MELYSFGKGTARPIQQFNSVNAQVTHLVKSQAQCSLVYIRLTENGVLGRHATVQNQIFFVVEGAGQVSGEDDIFYEIKTGQAAFWKEGEFHTTKTATGLAAVVIEGADISPGPGMRLLSHT